MKRTNWLLIPLMLALAACDATDRTPYPYTPQFVAPSDVPPRLLPIPPVVGSIEYNNEIDSILATQAKLTPAQKDIIKAEDHITPSMIVLPVIGSDYTEEKYPAMYNLLRHAASDAWRDADYTQDYWKRTRPWMADERIELLASRITRPGYPSGHSTTNHVWAHILSDLFPEKQDALFARAHEIGMDRVAGGAHFPSDVEAGKYYAAFIYQKMSKTPQYQSELATAHAEINAAIVMAPIVVMHPDPALGVTPVITPPAPMPPSAQDAPLPQGKAPIAPTGNLPVDCMHPQPGELQTGCR